MALVAPHAGDMFSDAKSSVEIADRFEEYKSALNKSLSSPRALPGAPDFEQQSTRGDLEKALGSADITKSLSPELVESVRTALSQSDLGKDWTVTNPVATGLAAFDLESPAKVLVPRPTPLRNRIARRKGIGTAHRYKRITGWTGSGTGGVGTLWPGITDTTTTAFQSVSYIRGAKISYAGDDVAVPYKQFSVSDQVNWSAQYSGQGYEDVRQLSQTALLWASMLLEERMLLGARGTDSGFVGAIVPTITIAKRAPVTGETKVSGLTTNVYVKVVGQHVWGHTAASTTATIAMIDADNDVLDVTVTNAASNGALSYDVYVSTGASEPATSAQWKTLSGTGSVLTVQGALLTSGTAVSLITADTSSYATGYDGVLSYVTGANSGYVKHVNGPLSTANPGAEFFDAFASLYDSVKADPDEVLANGNDRKQLSDLLKTASSASYRITVDNNGEAQNAHLGALVTGLQNEVTGKMVEVTVHPWLPQGTMPILSWTLPLPDSQISDVFAVYNVQDYVGVSWPVTQFAYEASSYWYGTLINYAPAWCGAIMGVTKA